VAVVGQLADLLDGVGVGILAVGPQLLHQGRVGPEVLLDQRLAAGRRW
jgi:hypothetical protein